VIFHRDGHVFNFLALCLAASTAAEPKTADMAAHPQAAPSIAASDAANAGDIEADAQLSCLLLSKQDEFLSRGRLPILRLRDGGQSLQVELPGGGNLRCVLRHQSSVLVQHQSREAAAIGEAEDQ
jgi:hypothetical protein